MRLEEGRGRDIERSNGSRPSKNHLIERQKGGGQSFCGFIFGVLSSNSGNVKYWAEKYLLTAVLGGAVPMRMEEESPSYSVVGRRVRYGDKKGGNDDNDRNSYSCRCFESSGRKEGNRGESAAAATMR